MWLYVICSHFLHQCCCMVVGTWQGRHWWCNDDVIFTSYLPSQTVIVMSRGMVTRAATMVNDICQRLEDKVGKTIWGFGWKSLTTLFDGKIYYAQKYEKRRYILLHSWSVGQKIYCDYHHHSSSFLISKVRCDHLVFLDESHCPHYLMGRYNMPKVRKEAIHSFTFLKRRPENILWLPPSLFLISDLKSQVWPFGFFGWKSLSTLFDGKI